MTAIRFKNTKELFPSQSKNVSKRLLKMQRYMLLPLSQQVDLFLMNLTLGGTDTERWKERWSEGEKRGA